MNKYCPFIGKFAASLSVFTLIVAFAIPASAQQLLPIKSKSGEPGDKKPANASAKKDNSSTGEANDLPKHLDDKQQSKLCESIFLLTKSADSSENLSVVIRRCQEALKHDELTTTTREYVSGLLSWAYGERAGKRIDIASQLKSINAKQSGIILNDALSDAEAATKLNSTNHFNFLYRGIIHFQLDNLDAAEKDFVRVCELAKGKSAGWFNLAELQSFQGDYQSAIKNYERALEISELDQQAINGLAHCHMATGQFRQALERFDFIVNLRPDSFHALVNRADANAKLGNWQRAYDDYLAANKMEASPITYQRLAWFLATCPDATHFKPETAKLLAEKSIEIGGENPENLAALSASLATSGEFQQAIPLLEKAIAMDALRPIARELKRELEQQVAMYKKEEAFFQTPPTESDTNKSSAKDQDGS